jgi:hypothetical protein
VLRQPAWKTQREQLDDQQKANRKQAEVLDLLAPAA